jgi:P4 family phage/plasmid primase-like protien
MSPRDDGPATGARTARGKPRGSRATAPETAAPIAAEIPESATADPAPASPSRRKRAPKASAAAPGAPAKRGRQSKATPSASDAAAAPGPDVAPAPRSGKARRARPALDDLDAPAPLVFGLPPEQRLALPKNDAGNAARLFAVLGDRLLYVSARGWHVAEGGRYRSDPEGIGAFRLASRLAAVVEEEARAAAIRPVSDFEAAAALRDEALKPKPAFATLDEAPRVIRSRHAAALLDYAVRCGNNRTIHGALEALRPHVVAALADLDRDPWRFVCADCVIDLRAVAAFAPPDPGAFLDEADRAAEMARIRATWRLPHDLAARPTRRSEVRFDPKATAPSFVAFLELVFPAPDVRAYALRMFALLLIGENVKQIAIFLHGAGGNGKSTLLNVLADVLGEYVAPARIELFLADRYASAGKATPEEVNLPGARAIIATEPDARDELSAKKIKAFTGGDARTARGLNKEEFTYRPSAIPLIAANRIPRIKDDSEGFWRRFRLVPFPVNLRLLAPELRRDPGDVLAELRAEAPGILNMLLDVLGEALRSDAPVPAAVGKLVAELRGESDPVGEFLTECTEPTATPTTSAADLYAAFKDFANDPEGRTKSMTTFGRDLRERGIEKVRTKSGFLYAIRLIPLGSSIKPQSVEVDHDPPF